MAFCGLSLCCWRLFVRLRVCASAICCTAVDFSTVTDRLALAYPPVERPFKYSSSAPGRHAVSARHVRIYGGTERADGAVDESAGIRYGRAADGAESLLYPFSSSLWTTTQTCHAAAAAGGAASVNE